MASIHGRWERPYDGTFGKRCGPILVRVMAHGAKVGRIVTTRPADPEKKTGVVRRIDRFYVYHRTGLPCRRCGTPIEEMMLGNRRVFYCPTDQAERAERTGNTRELNRIRTRRRELA